MTKNSDTNIIAGLGIMLGISFILFGVVLAILFVNIDKSNSDKDALQSKIVELQNNFANRCFVYENTTLRIITVEKNSVIKDKLYSSIGSAQQEDCGSLE